MSRNANGIVHGVTSVIFECMVCGKRWESRNGVGLAAQHWHKTGHNISGEVVIGWSFPKKVVAR